MGPNATFRQNSFDPAGFNPTNTSPPFFQIFDQGFLKVLGKAPTITEIAHNDTFAFAHEAPIYDAALDSVFFASNDGNKTQSTLADCTNDKLRWPPWNE
jgi:gluconolactonase